MTQADVKKAGPDSSITEATRREAVTSIFSQMRAVSVPLGLADPDKPSISSAMYRMNADSDSKVYCYDNAHDPSSFWVDFKKANVSEEAAPTKLLVSDTIDLASDVTAQSTPAEPYE